MEQPITYVGLDVHKDPPISDGDGTFAAARERTLAVREA
jgi:hypothetical protein